MRALTKHQKWIAGIAIWLVVFLIILTGSFRFSSDDWWWSTTYTALIVFATGITVIMWTSPQRSATADMSRPTKSEPSEPEA
jgi:hypothetical protein